MSYRRWIGSRGGCHVTESTQSCIGGVCPFWFLNPACMDSTNAYLALTGSQAGIQNLISATLQCLVSALRVHSTTAAKGCKRSLWTELDALSLLVKAKEKEAVLTWRQGTQPCTDGASFIKQGHERKAKKWPQIPESYLLNIRYFSCTGISKYQRNRKKTKNKKTIIINIKSIFHLKRREFGRSTVCPVFHEHKIPFFHV